MPFELLVSDDHIVLFRKRFYLLCQLQGIEQVDSKNTIEKSNKERERQIIRKPVECVKNVWVYKEIIDRAQCCPYERIQRTYYAFIVEFVSGVVPQLDVHFHNEYLACNKLYHCHCNSHKQKKYKLLQSRVVSVYKFFKSRQQIKSAKPEAV